MTLAATDPDEALAALDVVLAALLQPLCVVEWSHGDAWLMRPAADSFGSVGRPATDDDHGDMAARKAVEGWTAIGEAA